MQTSFFPHKRTEPGSAKLVRTHPHRWRNIGIGLIGALALFALLGFFVVPPVAKHLLVSKLSEELGRDVTIADVDFNPFAMSARIKGLSIKERRSSEVFIGIGTVVANLEYRSIVRRAPVLKELTIEQPYVHVARYADGKTYNFSDLIEKYAKPKPTAKPADAQNGARFSLNNIRLSGGKVEFDDAPMRAHHTISDINLAIPFISNLPDVIDIYVQPAFSARVNGTPLGLSALSKPFKDTHETSVNVNLERLDLPKYVQYVPLELGFKVPSGTLDARITAAFSRAPGTEPSVALRGEIALADLKLTELDGTPLLELQSLKVPIARADIFGRSFDLGNVEIDAPHAFVRRNKEGKLNWLAVKPNDAKPAAKAAESAPLKLTLAQAHIANGKIDIEDRVPAKGFRMQLAGIDATLRKFALPQKEPVAIEAALHTELDEAVKIAGALLIDPLTAEGTLEASKLRLVSYQAYYRDLIQYNLEDGVATVSGHFSVRKQGDAFATHLSALDVELADMRMRKPGERETFLSNKRAHLQNADVDLDKRVLSVEQLSVSEGALNLIREPDGALNATRILPAPKGASTEGRQGSPWLIALNRADIEKWQVAFTDQTFRRPVKIVAADLRVDARNLSNRKDAKGHIALQAKLNDTGTIKVKGPLAINPISAELNIELERFGLVPLQPYFTDRVNLLMSSGDLSAKGLAKIAFGANGPEVNYQGNARLSDFASVDKPRSEDLLRWKSLYVGGIAYNHTPMSLSVDQVALADFFARVIIFPEGRLNLQNLMSPEKSVTADASASDNAAAAAETKSKGGARTRTAEVAQDSSKSSVRESPIKIAKITFQNGDIDFTDLFIKPNYSASLSEIGGNVTGLSSQSQTAADVDLRGRFAKTAPVEIKGKINPLVKDLLLDLKAVVRDIELGPLSPYSGKYVGYAIEKGKMSFDVTYKVENRQLTATNRLVLNQLTFGEKVDSPQATKLPVLLAVSLLKDRRGNIDVNLPISGSLDDPKFSVGGIVLRIIFNLIEKAVTSPFALLGNLVGGGSGEELSYIEFEPGRAALSSHDQDKVAKLQHALEERPAVKLDITGRSDPERDREGLRRYRFEQQLKAQKLKDSVRHGESVNLDSIQIAPEENEKYLRRAYKNANFAKPKNALGFNKDLPPPEMEKLLLTNTTVSDDDLIALANQRAQAAKDAITKDEKVALDRVYLLAPKVAVSKDEKKPGGRVDFSLK